MARPNSRQTLIDYSLRELGAPVIEININQDQLEDRVDDAFDLFKEFHYDGTIRTYLKHQVTAADVTNEYITLDPSIIYVTKLFPMTDGGSSGTGMFSIQYQMRLQDFASMNTFMGDFAYYEQMQQYMSLLDMKLNGTPQTTFSHKQHRLYIHGDFADDNIREGDWLVAEVYQVLDPEVHTAIYDDRWLKNYTTQLFKKQWGSNLKKFGNMQLPGGVVINGQELFDEAELRLKELKQDLRDEHEMPAEFYVG